MIVKFRKSRKFKNEHQFFIAGKKLYKFKQMLLKYRSSAGEYIIVIHCVTTPCISVFEK